jgi:hydrogenase-4 membrane subunit HyfE
MMMTVRSSLRVLAPALAVLAAALAASNWYVQPERAAAWAAALAVLGGMLAVLVLAPRFAGGGSTREGARAVDAVMSAVAFASLMMAVSLGAQLAASLGGADRTELGTRVTMALFGAFLMFTGNAMPKMLPPLSATQCDPARVQQFQRLSGWTWVLVGLGLAAIWLALPLPVARPASISLVVLASLVVLTALVRMRRSHEREA